MNHTTFKEEKQLIESATDFPSISIVLPFDTAVSLQQEVLHKLKLATDQLKKALEASYPVAQTELVLDKLQQLIGNINLPGDKKSIVLFVSPKVEKVFFLNIVVPQRIIIDHSFEIRDLVSEHLQGHESLVLLLSGEKAMLYRRKYTELTHIQFSVPWHIAAYENDAPERVSNFSDPDARKEQLLEKFLRHIDKGLSIVLKSYPFQVYLVGPKKVAAHFKKISKHQDKIKACIYGNFLDARPSEIISLLQAEEKKVDALGMDIKQQLERAAGEKKLAIGSEEVWSAASHKNGKLLLVEEDFTFSTPQTRVVDAAYTEGSSLIMPVHNKDAVEEVIENVISCGGDIGVLEKGTLNDYGHIALIEYYSE